ncbi:LysR family transcriptional regulator [Pseudomonas sp. Pseusp122]|uniref:LysR family transcriptional regulator n=1 Tax=unclassified Pseudomonas TaxID=196821 RepID=UPI0039A6AF94
MLDDLHSMDLNLLVVFAALMRERNVTRCANKLLVGQPAISASLRRLRTLFGDPLFVRSGHGVRPTDKAIEIAQLIGPALELIDAAVSKNEPFTAVECQARFGIVLSGGVGSTLVTGLLKPILAGAPGISIAVERRDPGSISERLPAESVSLELGYFALKTKGRVTQAAARCSSVLVRASDSAPVLSADELSQRAHVVVPYGAGLEQQLDEKLANVGLSRKVALELASADGLDHILAGTDRVAIIPDIEARHLQGAGIVIDYLPDHLADHFDLHMAWSEGKNLAASEVWFRHQFIEQISRFTPLST